MTPLITDSFVMKAVAFGPDENNNLYVTIDNVPSGVNTLLLDIWVPQVFPKDEPVSKFLKNKKHNKANIRKPVRSKKERY